MNGIVKSFYQIIPFKKQLFSLVKFVWTPPQGIYKHLYFVGNIRVSIDKNKKFKIRHFGFELENEIFWKGLAGGWENESVRLWIMLCEKADVIIDIGANTGVYSLIAKAVNPKSRVYAFEPVKRVCSRLNENIRLNNYDITIIDKAVSNFDGKAIIYDTCQDHIYSVTVNKHYFSSDVKLAEVEIETITLNTFIKHEKLNKIDLIKIDVETHEPEVLEGFSEYIMEYKPVMLIEILNNEVGERVEKLVRGCGYLYFNIDEKGSVRLVSKIVTSDYLNYLFCDKRVAAELGLL